MIVQKKVFGAELLLNIRDKNLEEKNFMNTMVDYEDIHLSLIWAKSYKTSYKNIENVML